MDQQRIDTKLREAFRRNSPPDRPAHLAAALHPERAFGGEGATRQVREQTVRRHSARRPARPAAITVGVVVVAALVGIGSWQAVSHLGGRDRVVIIGDQTTATTARVDLKAQLTEGVWELRADRQATDLSGVQFPSDELPESAYHAIAQGPVFTAVFSETAAKVALKGELGGSQFSATGIRKSMEDLRIGYELEEAPGGRLTVWFTYEGLQAEFTQYGSGLPIIFSYRGKLVNTAAPDYFSELYAASVAAVDALGPTRVSMTQIASGQVVGGDASANGAASSPGSTEHPQTTTAEELIDIAGGRARLTVETSEPLVTTTVVNGKERLDIVRNPLLSSNAFATRAVSLQRPVGFPLGLWAGDGVAPLESYADLLQTGGAVLSDTTVASRSDGGKRLGWKRTATKGTATIALALDADLLPVRIELAGRADVEGTDLEYSLTIDYRFETVASLVDADFSVEVPSYARLTGTTYELSALQPLSDQVDWGQYWLGEQMADWVVAFARFEIHSDGSEPSQEFVYLAYQKPDAASPAENLGVYVWSPDAATAASARQMGEQRVDLGLWTHRDMTVAGKPATVYMGAADATDGRIDSVYVFLPDAFINVDLWDMADPQTVLDAIVPVAG
jgi:hypothetical protein